MLTYLAEAFANRRLRASVGSGPFDRRLETEIVSHVSSFNIDQ